MNIKGIDVSEMDKQVAKPVGEDKLDYHALNALPNLHGGDGKIQFDKGRMAAWQFFLQHVNQNTVFFRNLREKLNYLVENHYYEIEALEKYEFEDIKALFKQAYAHKFRFQTFLGAYKYYTSYTLRTSDGEHYLEHYEDRVCTITLTLADDDLGPARHLVDEIVAGHFQLATPTFLSSNKAQRGEPMSCFLLRIEDNMESIDCAISSSLQLSKRGGGIALLLSNPHERGTPIKHIGNQSSGIVPVMELLEDSFSYANQLSARQGTDAVYLHAHHPDTMHFLDTKRENADERIRIKSLLLGVVIPDITFELAKCNDDMHLFSPYDVERAYGKPFADINITENYADMIEDPHICKQKISARRFFQTIVEIKFESGYLYIMFENTVNHANPIEGRINMSNLCSETLRVNTPSTYNASLSHERVGEDISYNLGSLSIAMTMDSPSFGRTVEAVIHGLAAVSEQTSVDSVPSIRKGNDGPHTVDLGRINLHGYLGREKIIYGLGEDLDFTNAYFATVLYAVLRASSRTVYEHGQKFVNFENSDYVSGKYLDNFDPAEFQPKAQHVKEIFKNSTAHIPGAGDWAQLKTDITEYDLLNHNLQAVSPTGSTSYISNSTSSIHPIVSQTEIREEGKIGRIYYPAPHLDNNNREYFQNAHKIGYEKITDTYAIAIEHVDQGLSLALFFRDMVSTRDFNHAQIYAQRRGIKTLYYIHLRQITLEGTEIEGYVSYML